MTDPWDWTAVASGTTVTKTTTQANNFRGFKSLLLTGAGYTLTSVYDVSPGDIFIHGAAGKGTAATTVTTYSLLDVTNSATLEPVAMTGTNLQHCIRQTVIPAGCYQVRAKLQTSATSVFDYTHSHMMGLEGRQIEAPSWLGEQWRLMGFGPADYGRDLGTRQYNARSQHFNGWKRPRDYQLMPLTEEANPYHVQITKRDQHGSSVGLPAADMWYHGLRSYGDRVTMTGEGGDGNTTEAPEDLVMAACLFAIATMLLTKTEDAKWARLQAEAGAVLEAQRDAQGFIEEEYARSVYVPGGRGGA